MLETRLAQLVASWQATGEDQQHFLGQPGCPQEVWGCPRSSVLNLRSSILSRQSLAVSPQSSILNPRFSILSPRSSILSEESLWLKVIKDKKISTYTPWGQNSGGQGWGGQAWIINNHICTSWWKLSDLSFSLLFFKSQLPWRQSLREYALVKLGQTRPLP